MSEVQIIEQDSKLQKKALVAKLLGERLTFRILGAFIKVAAAYYQRRLPHFESIELETINRCNSKCSFCPVNVKDDPRPLARMDDELFRKIIGDLKQLGYRDRLALYSNNEPFLDKQLAQKLRYVRNELPEAHLFLYTNGTALNFERYRQVMDAGLDELVINNYADDLMLHANIQPILEKLEGPEYSDYARRTQVVIQRLTVVRTNRAGRAPNKLAEKVDSYLGLSHAGCVLPFRQMVVRPDGKVSLCGNDSLGEVTLGDLRTQSLMEVWRGDAYRQVRRHLQSNGRRSLPICGRCDYDMVSRDIRLISSNEKRRWLGRQS